MSAINQYIVTVGSSLCQLEGMKGLPWCLCSKESTCKAGDMSSIPGSGRSPGGGHGNPLQYSCLENPMDRGAWEAHRVTKSQTQLKPLSTAHRTEGMKNGEKKRFLRTPSLASVNFHFNWEERKITEKIQQMIHGCPTMCRF